MPLPNSGVGGGDCHRLARRGADDTRTAEPPSSWAETRVDVAGWAGVRNTSPTRKACSQRRKAGES
jgi:hypothetical protein